MSDIVIFYELPERELNNANLLKAEFERRGYTVEIKDYYNYHEIISPIKEKPKLVIAQSGYDNSDLEGFTLRFKNKIDKMLNMRYEQVISKRVLNSSLHYPRGYMKNMCHICWSEYIKEEMIKEGIHEENLIVTGDIKTDFSNEKFDSFYKTKEELAEEFDLDKDKDWILFISSFTFNEDVDDKRLMRLNNNLEDGKYLQKWDCESKDILLEWIEKFVKNNPDKEFIYRPHPAEHNTLSEDTRVSDLEKKYSNFNYINAYAIQEWIRPCEYLNTITSTSIIDVYLQNKQCNILRPVPLNPDFDNPLLVNADYITSYDDFEYYNTVGTNNKFPVPQEDVDKYYYFGDKLVYENICDFAEKMIKEDKYEADFYPDDSKFSRLRFAIKKSLSMPKLVPKILKSIFSNKSASSKTESNDSKYVENEEKIFKIINK